MSLWFVLVACAPEGEETASAAGDGEVEVEAFTGRPVAEPTGTCPSFAANGTQDLTVDGVVRQIEAYWPPAHEGPIGLLFAWHGLGDRADSFASAVDLEAFAKDNDILVVVPYSTSPDLVTWNFIAGGGNDLLLFEDVRSCAAQHFDLDLARVWSTGFSFGALWTTFLTLQVSDVLAGTVTFSGGTGEELGLTYFTPLAPTPVLAAWGGAIDVFDTGFFRLDFGVATADFTGGLEADGHSVIRCDHGLGHTIPPEGHLILENFLLRQRFGVESPYADHDVSDLPDYCF